MDFTNTITKNTLRAIRFDRPEHIPVVFWTNPTCWHHYPPDVLFELMAEHRILFPDFGPEYKPPELAPWECAGQPYTDAWGCVWETTDDGITGAVTGHPLSEWNALEGFTPPDPAKTNGMAAIDWSVIEDKILKATAEGKHIAGSLEHGHAFLRLSYLRGYERLLFDMPDKNQRLWQLIDMVETFSMGIVRRYVDLGVAMMRYPEDRGMQLGPMLWHGLPAREITARMAVPREHFRTYIKIRMPGYQVIRRPGFRVS